MPSKTNQRKNSHDFSAALNRLQTQWNRLDPKPPVDRLAKAASMSNNSVLDLLASKDSKRRGSLVTRLQRSTGRSSKHTWARLAMQLYLVLSPLDTSKNSTQLDEDGQIDLVKDWIRPEEWDISTSDFVKLLDEARNKINSAEEQLSGTVRADLVRIGIVPLVYLGDDIRPDRERTGNSTNASFLGAFGRAALRSIRSEYEFSYHQASLRELNPFTHAGVSSAVKIGAFGIVARERDLYEHIPIPGWSSRIACMGPDIPRVRRAAEQRAVFSTRGLGFTYFTMEDSSPSAFLGTMFGKGKAHHSLKHNGNNKFAYDAKLLAASYADELSAARSTIRGEDDGAIPLLVVDDAMADEVARRVSEILATTSSMPTMQFVDMLRDIPEGPAVPLSIQVRRDDEDLVRVLKHAICGTSFADGELFTLGAIQVARIYARVLVWIFSKYYYEYSCGPGVLASDSLLVRLQTYYRDRLTDQNRVLPPTIPAFCRLWNSGTVLDTDANQDSTRIYGGLAVHRTPPVHFFFLLVDELVSRLVPSESYHYMISNKIDAKHAKAVQALVDCVLPGKRTLVKSWAESRLRDQGVRLPAYQDDWKEGPADSDSQD